MVAIEVVMGFTELISLLLCTFENFQLIDLTYKTRVFPPTTTPLTNSLPNFS